jgi:hypothetical protein
LNIFPPVNIYQTPIVYRSGLTAVCHRQEINLIKD